VRVWDTAKIRVNRAGAIYGGILEGEVGEYGHASASSHTGQVRMVWNSGREFVSGSAPLVAATLLKYTFVGVTLCRLAPTFISQWWCGLRCVMSFYEYMTSRVQILFRLPSVEFVVEKSG